MAGRISRNLHAVLALAAGLAWSTSQAGDSLPSWSDGASKQAITSFVVASTTPNDSRYVPPAERIGAETFTWPDGGTTMFRGEKNTQWEGGYRVPTLIKWPGVIKPGTVINDIGAHEDMLTTLLAAAGDKTVKDDLLKGRRIGKSSYKVHLDGYDLGPALRGEGAWPRREFIYWTDDGSVAALRYDNWKITFLEQQAEGLKVWQEPFTELRAPKIANLRMDPFERAEHEYAMGYQRWYMDRMFLIAPAGAYVGKWLQSFKEFPPRQKPGSFNLERVMEAVTSNAGKQ